MSLFTDRAVTCPGCRKRTTHRVARSLNAQRSPQLLHTLLSGGFQRFSCQTCHFPYVVEDPFLFIDFAAKLWIGQFPRAWEPQWQTLERQPQDWFHHGLGRDAPDVAQSLGPGFLVRAVFGLEALREKVLCLRAGLDDRVVEMVKLDLMRRHPRLSLHPAVRPTLVSVAADKLVLRTAEATLHVGMELLRHMGQQDGWAPVLRELSEGPYVSLGRILS